MNFSIMIKLTKVSEDEDAIITQKKENDNTFNNKILTQAQVYCLEASIDILKLYDTLNKVELNGSTPVCFGGRNSSGCGDNGHSPTIIFPDELQHPSSSQSMPNTDGGSVSSFLSPLSNPNMNSFEAGGEGQKNEATQI